MKRFFRLMLQVAVLVAFIAPFFVYVNTAQALEDPIDFSFKVTCKSEKGESFPLEGATVGLYHQINDPGGLFIPKVSGLEHTKVYTVITDNNGKQGMRFLWGKPDDNVNKLPDGKYVFLISYNDKQLGSRQDAFFARASQAWVWLYRISDFLISGLADEVELYGDGYHEWNLDSCPAGSGQKSITKIKEEMKTSLQEACNTEASWVQNQKEACIAKTDKCVDDASEENLSNPKNWELYCTNMGINEGNKTPAAGNPPAGGSGAGPSNKDKEQIKKMQDDIKNSLYEEVCQKLNTGTTKCFIDLNICVNKEEITALLMQALTKPDKYLEAKDICKAELPSPAPPAGSSEDYTLDSLQIMDVNGNPKKEFIAGDTVGFKILIKNKSDKVIENISLGYMVSGPKDSDGPGSLIVDAGQRYKAKAGVGVVDGAWITRTLPSTAKPGLYTFTGSANGKYLQETFTVTSSGTQPPPGTGTPPIPPAPGGGNQPPVGGWSRTGPGAGTGQGSKTGTTTRAYIHGYWEGDTRIREGSFDDPGADWISVGSRTNPNDGSNSACAFGFVTMTLTKVDAGKETNIPVSFAPVSEGNQVGPATESRHRNCWSYQAKLLPGMKKDGTYRFKAVFPETDSYKGSEDTIEVTYTGNTAKLKTKTEVKVQTGRTSFRLNNSTPKVALIKLLQGVTSTNVAGVSAREENGQVRIVNNPSGPDETITLIPESSIGNGSCDARNLPVIHFVVTKILRGGGVEIIDDNQNYPNCEPWILPLSRLGDLNQISRIVATASLADDPQSSYQPSQGTVVITVSDDGVAANPYVKLSSNPSPLNISSSDDRVIVIASTNKQAANPVLKVNRNGEERLLQASSSLENCKDGMGNCEYSFIIYQPNGDYEVSFINSQASDFLRFSTQNKAAGDIVSVGLLVGKGEVPLDINGGQIDLQLDGKPTTAFQLVIHYKDLIFNFSQPADWNCVYSQDGSCYEGYTKDQSTCNWVNGTCFNPVGCEYRGGPVACPQGGTATPIARPTPVSTPVPASCNSSSPDFKYNQCIACNTSQSVCQDANGNFITGKDQQDAGCSSWCNNPNPVPTPASTPPPSGPDAGAPGKDCIYWQDNKCYSGKVINQSACPSMTTITNVCASPTGGCRWGEGSKEVNCATGEVLL
ncbi:MAG: hypothetical protein UT04_C0011G0031 [Candidatus Daviesbacteria bacterium GW2011_GWF2_38_7]|nr:MAG: hypothetical protein UT04_C0011G0031 [Candidatus Daviesbacteria bacterium GW2011_GWF2_38_7]